MKAPKSLINELEDAISHNDVARRAETLRRLTDLFVLGSTRYSGEQIALFDDVMGRLLDEVEVTARVAFGHRLASIPNAPPKVMRELALDNAIEVAGPVLTHSEQIDDMTLVESAKTKSQDHLLAISRRKVLPENVTDVLVDRGNQQVALSTVKNPGAAFSEFGYSTLVRRSQKDGKLALFVWIRADIPRQHLLKLFANASESVRLTLEATDRRKADLIRELVAAASDEIQAVTREKSAGFAAAYSHVEDLYKSNKLDEGKLASFAREGKFDETAVALSILCDLPIGLIERAFTQKWSEQLLVIAKALDLTWNTTKTILLLESGAKDALAPEFDECFKSFARLQVETAKKALQFYRLREQAATPVSY
jgi:uncharacterized protein (DUF2336 family)